MLLLINLGGVSILILAINNSWLIRDKIGISLGYNCTVAWSAIE